MSRRWTGHHNPHRARESQRRGGKPVTNLSVCLSQSPTPPAPFHVLCALVPSSTDGRLLNPVHHRLTIYHACPRTAYPHPIRCCLLLCAAGAPPSGCMFFCCNELLMYFVLHQSVSSPSKTKCHTPHTPDTAPFPSVVIRNMCIRLMCLSRAYGVQLLQQYIKIIPLMMLAAYIS